MTVYHFGDFLAGNILPHAVTFGDFMAGNFLAGDFLGECRLFRIGGKRVQWGELTECDPGKFVLCYTYNHSFILLRQIRIIKLF